MMIIIMIIMMTMLIMIMTMIIMMMSMIIIIIIIQSKLTSVQVRSLDNIPSSDFTVKLKLA